MDLIIVDTNASDMGSASNSEEFSFFFNEFYLFVIFQVFPETEQKASDWAEWLISSSWSVREKV